MANPWFRLYAEFANDPKVQMLSETDQRRLIMVFCMRCNGDVTLQDDEVAFQLRISNEEWQRTKAIFVSKNFINDANEVLNWDKRQFVSDSSAVRVAKHRENKKRESNVTVTPPDTDTDTDTKEEKPSVRTSSALRFDEFWNIYPSVRKVGKKACQAKWKSKKLDGKADVIIAHVAAMGKTQSWLEGFNPAPATYLNQERWNDEIPSSTPIQPKNGKPWFITGSGIEAKGVELNIARGKLEAVPEWYSRIRKSSGVTKEMVDAANREFGA